MGSLSPKRNWGDIVKKTHQLSALVTHDRRRSYPARTGHRRNAQLLGLLGATAITSVAALQMTATSGASTTTHKTQSAVSKTVKPDLAYFAGKTITFINGSAPGSGGDSLARPLAPYIQHYLGAAAVNVENITGSGSIASQDTIAAAAPDGLTIGELAASSNFEGYLGVSHAVDFNQTQETILGGVYTSPGSCIFASPSAPDQSARAFLKDKTVHRLGDVVPGTTDMIGRSILWSYRIPTLLVTGYTSESGLAQGFARGDEPYAVSALTAFISNAHSGTAKCILRMGVGKVPTYLATYPILKGATDLTQLMAQEPPATKQGKAVINELEALVATPAYAFFAPKGVAPRVALALQDAVKYAEAQPQVRAQYVQQGNVPGYTTPAKVLSELKAVAKHINLLKTPVSSVG